MGKINIGYFFLAENYDGKKHKGIVTAIIRSRIPKITKYLIRVPHIVEELEIDEFDGECIVQKIGNSVRFIIEN